MIRYKIIESTIKQKQIQVHYDTFDQTLMLPSILPTVETSNELLNASAPPSNTTLCSASEVHKRVVPSLVFGVGVANFNVDTLLGHNTRAGGDIGVMTLPVMAPEGSREISLSWRSSRLDNIE